MALLACTYSNFPLHFHWICCGSHSGLYNLQADVSYYIRKGLRDNNSCLSLLQEKVKPSGSINVEANYLHWVTQ